LPIGSKYGTQLLDNRNTIWHLVFTQNQRPKEAVTMLGQGRIEFSSFGRGDADRMAQTEDGYFGRIADRYSECRPGYPEALFDFLVSQCDRRDCAWDCATGNGQAAVSLASRFARVIATDRSRAQLAEAKSQKNVEFRVASAEDSGILRESVDLITVAQALHWFDLARFSAEADRVAHVGTVLGGWWYQKPEVESVIDGWVGGLYDAPCLAPYWPRERQYIAAGYKNIHLPFGEVEAPVLAIQERWSWRRFDAYLRTWQAVADSAADTEASAFVANQFAELASAWGVPDVVRAVRWQLWVRACKKRT
jgi:ubiquinone/menaquinone biosynthesis C-methylase UbiE